jgi:FkbH-like protein
MQDVSKGEGRTVLFVSHNMDSMLNLCHNGIVLENGEIKKIASISECVNYYLLDKSSHSYHNESSHSQLYIESAEFVGEQRNKEGIFYLDEPITMQFKLHRDANFSECDKAIFDVAIYNHTTRICTIEQSLKEMSNSNDAVLTITIPPYLLAPGNLYLEIATHIPNVEILHHVKNTCSFTILDTGSNMLKYNGKNQGVILAICSKNNENDVLEVWKNRTDIVLKKDDFVTYRINWLDKATNIKSIANELNIGLDSFVFIDDNPTERELIKQQLPEVVVPDWVNQPYELPNLLKNIVDNYFSVYSVTDEDRQKTNQYKIRAEREVLQSQFSNLDDFIKSLNIELSIEPINDVSIVRAAQMTQKTNQFNLTTKRYTESDIRLILSNGGLGWTLSVKDKFGDNGITGLCLVTESGNIDTFLMSCRVLGKKIENVFISEIFTKLVNANKKQITAQYIPTLKNDQVSDFYDRNGFEVMSKESDGTVHYQKDLTDFVHSKNENYTII